MKHIKTAASLALAVAGAYAAMTAGTVLAHSSPGDRYPPKAEAGKCYQKVLIPARYDHYDEHFEAVPARTMYRKIIPAVYSEEMRQVRVREEQTENVTIPATYKTVTETVVVRPSYTRTETVPAVYETVTERVLVREAHNEWRRGVPAPDSPTTPGRTMVTPTGEVFCLVTVPAEYRTTTRQVLKTPASTVQVEVPAETKNISRTVVDQEARVVTRVIPAEYRSVKTPVMVTPESFETYETVPVYVTTVKHSLVRAARSEWQEVGCMYPPHDPAPR